MAKKLGDTEAALEAISEEFEESFDPASMELPGALDRLPMTKPLLAALRPPNEFASRLRLLLGRTNPKQGGSYAT